MSFCRVATVTCQKFKYTIIFHHPLVSILLKILKSYMISMHKVSFQKNSLFYTSYFEYIEQGVFRKERIIFGRYYVVPGKCEIVFKLLASSCIIVRYLNQFNVIMRLLIYV